MTRIELIKLRNLFNSEIQRKNKIILMEVKSDKTINYNSLTKYNSKYINDLYLD